jgi:hypothetical protein
MADAEVGLNARIVARDVRIFLDDKPIASTKAIVCQGIQQTECLLCSVPAVLGSTGATKIENKKRNNTDNTMAAQLAIRYRKDYSSDTVRDVACI